MKRIFAAAVVLGVFLVSTVSFAGVPLNNLEGVGGIAFNPLAYTAGTNIEKTNEDNGELSYQDIFTKPQFGIWYVNLGDVSVDWTAIGVAESFFKKRLEISYGFETIAPTGENIHKHNIGAKVLILEENFKGLKFVPAVSVGTIWKTTSGAVPGVSSSGFDYYAVATKLITELPRPVLLSAGVLSTQGYVTGVFGFDGSREQTLFGNVDILPVPNVAVGFEYKQGAHFDAFKNADYWDAHVAWFVNPNLTLVGAFVNAGDSKSTKEAGLGNGVVLSAQYAF